MSISTELSSHEQFIILYGFFMNGSNYIVLLNTKLKQDIIQLSYLVFYPNHQISHYVNISSFRTLVSML